MKVLAAILGILMLTVMSTAMLSDTASAADGQTCAMLFDFNNGRTEWVDVPLVDGMDGFDMFLNATSMLGLAETHAPTPPFGHTVMTIDGYSGNYNFTNPESPYDFWRLMIWNSNSHQWQFSSTLIDGINPFTTKAIAWKYTRYPYMGYPDTTPDNRDSWIAGRNDFYNTGSDLSYNASSVELKWAADLGNGAVDAPVLYQAGRLYVTTSGVLDPAGTTYTTNARLFCLSSSGEVIWSAEMGRGHHVAGPYVWNGAVYAPSADGNLYSFDSGTGALKWTYMVASGGITSSPLMYQNIIVVAGANGNIVGVSQNGARVWNTALPTTVSSAPALLYGILYVGGGDGSLYAVAADGKGQKWSEPIGGRITGSPISTRDQVMVTYSDYSGSTPSGGGIAAVSLEGALLWKTSTDHTPGSGSLTTNGVVAATSAGLSMVGLNGAAQWTADLGAVPGGSPVAVSGMTYVTTSEPSARLLGVNRGGGVVWSVTLDPAGAVVGSPSIGGGQLYLPSSNGRLYAYGFTALQPSELPVAAFNFTVVDRAVTFDASGSSGGEGGLSYTWDFGDGETAEGIRVKHTFGTMGNHTVVLMVTDTLDQSANLTRAVNLDNPPAPDPGTEPGPDTDTSTGSPGGVPIWVAGLGVIAVIAGVTMYLRWSKRKT
jgi:outer membrane protein assembly factor BamB